MMSRIDSSCGSCWETARTPPSAFVKLSSHTLRLNPCRGWSALTLCQGADKKGVVLADIEIHATLHLHREAMVT